MKRAPRLVCFATITVVLALTISTGSLFGIDLYLHKRAEKSAGLNMWGYRGPLAGRKTPGEARVVVLGGSTVFGYGVTWDRAFPAVLERLLNDARRQQNEGPVSVVNLGYNNEGAYSFAFTMEDYQYLDYDVVCLYEGYNDLMGDDVGANSSVYRRESPVFRLTGYLPIFPLVFREKAMALMYGGDLRAAYGSLRTDEPPVFKANLAERATAAALESAANVGDLIDRQLERLSKEPAREVPKGMPTVAGCVRPWAQYCESVYHAVTWALVRGKSVVVVSQPHLHAALTRQRHIEQQRALGDMLQRHFVGNPSVVHVALGDRIDLADRTISYDGMHLTEFGNERLAAELLGPMVLILPRRGSALSQ